MKKIITFIALLFIQPLYACQCLEVFPTFCESLRAWNIDYVGYPAVATCIKLDDYYHGAHFQIIEVIAGSFEEDTITVWGPGSTCRVSFEEYNVGDTLILLPMPLLYVSPSQILEQVGDFFAHLCFMSVLPIHNDTVWGPVAQPNVLNLPYQAFKDYVADCYPYTTAADLFAPPNGDLIRLLPNPATTQLTLYCSLPVDSPICANIYDMSGKLVQSIVLPPAFSHSFSVADLTSGVYICEVGNVRQKIAIVH